MTTNPWIGLDSYREGQILYGRSREIRDLSMAVFYNRQTIVYGRSGTGKSSLLHAGIFPEARLRGCLPISIRFDHSGEMSYREQLIRTITTAIEAAGGEVRDLLEEENRPESLWEFFHRYQFLRDGNPLTPLLVVDQFEEIFTLSHKKEDVQRFFTELGDLLNDVMPDYLQQTAVTSKATDTSSIFGSMTFQTMESRYLTDPSYHLVLVLREDYLSYLERYSQRIPALKQNRYGLMPITYQQALEIIMQPRPGLVSNEVADAIIRHVVTETDINDETPVDAAILSLFLSRLYEKKGDNPVINLQLVNEQGEALLEDFYAEVVAPLDRKTVYYLEDILINADGHRENVTLETLYKNDWCRRDVVETLEASHLLRLFSYGDVQRVEFAHDIICPIVVRNRIQRNDENRYRKQQLHTFWGYTLGTVACFLVVFLWIKIHYWRIEYETKGQRFSKMENSMIEKACRDDLQRHNTYGAIRLLINTFPKDLSEPYLATSSKECLLREVMDTLYFGKSSQVGINGYCTIWKDTLQHLFCMSRSGKLIAENNDFSSIARINDVHTGALVQSFEHRMYNSGHINDVDISVQRSDSTIYSFGLITDDYRALFISDISPDDSRALIIADDTTILECHITGNDAGYTRMVLHDFHTPLQTACYSNDGKWIAVVTKDGKYYLYDSKYGHYQEDGASKAFYYVELNEMRKELILSSYSGKNGIMLFDHTIIDRNRIYKGDIDFDFSQIYRDGIASHLYTMSPEDAEYWQPIMDSVVYSGSDEFYIESSVLDSLLLAKGITVEGEKDKAFYEKHIGEIADSYFSNPELYKQRKTLVYCISPDKKRIMYAGKLRFAENNQESYLVGEYVDNAMNWFYYNDNLPMQVNTLHFTDDNQFVVINVGEDTQTILPMKPLPELLEECKGYFFKWEMDDIERFRKFE